MYKRATCHLYNIIVFSNTHVHVHVHTNTRHTHIHTRRFIVYFSSPPVERIAVRHFVNFPSSSFPVYSFLPYLSFLFLSFSFFLRSTLRELFLKKTPLYHAEPVVRAENKLRINKHVYKAKKGANRQDSRQWFSPFDFWG